MSSEQVQPHMSFWSLACVVFGFIVFFYGIGLFFYQVILLHEAPYWFELLMSFNSLLLACIVLRDHRKKSS